MPADARRAWNRLWLVDPLDGTREFVKRNGEFTVNIALIEDGVPVFGVIQAPVTGRAVAWRARTRRVPPRRRCATCRCRHARAGRARRCASRPAVRIAIRAPAAMMERIGDSEPVALGSSLKFCRLAEGGMDVYPRFGPTSEWDTAAGQCDPGGRRRLRASIRDGRPFRYNQRETLLNGDFLALGRSGVAVAGMALNLCGPCPVARGDPHAFAGAPLGAMPLRDVTKSIAPRGAAYTGSDTPRLGARLLIRKSAMHDEQNDTRSSACSTSWPACATANPAAPGTSSRIFATIAPYTIEEAYEVADAIDRNDLPTLKDELGDLLLQVVFHAQMAQEQGAFDFGDVVAAICDKMMRRHPHVFADVDAWRTPRRRRARGRRTSATSARQAGDADALRARRHRARHAGVAARGEAAGRAPPRSASTGRARRR